LQRRGNEQNWSFSNCQVRMTCNRATG
jgi:hypothetical protein